MATNTINRDKPNDRLLAWGIAAVVHVLLFFLMFISWNFSAPPEEIFGDGIPLRMGDVVLAGGNDTPVANPGGNNSDQQASVPNRAEETPQRSDRGDQDVATQENGNVVLPNKDKRPTDGDAQKRAEEAARREEERQRRELDEKLGGGGQGNGTPVNNGNGTGNGQQGGPDGGLGQQAGKGIGTLSGKIKDRSIPGNQVIDGNYSQTGTVVVEICIDASGQVVSTKYTIHGSTTSDPVLKEAALKYAKQMKFSAKPEALGNECGEMKVVFKKN
jgi:TonB family protein